MDMNEAGVDQEKIRRYLGRVDNRCMAHETGTERFRGRRFANIIVQFNAARDQNLSVVVLSTYGPLSKMSRQVDDS